jgi:hypothetical protein
MTELSPAAKAVLDAFENASDGEYVEGVWVVNERTMLSAALQAAADQLFTDWNGMCCAEHLKAISVELESTSQPS